jgi:hypothetical protein
MVLNAIAARIDLPALLLAPTVRLFVDMIFSPASWIVSMRLTD